MDTKIVSRNLFEVENARNLTAEEVATTFVPTQAYWRLLSAKNHIVLGARGSGKTVLARMLSHEHLSLCNDEKARDIIDSKSFIGIYTPMKLEWVSALRNKPWQTQAEKEQFFQWRLNIATSLSLLKTIRSCLDTYIDEKGKRIRVEEEIANELNKYWLGEKTKKLETLSSIAREIKNIEYLRQQQIAKKRIQFLINGENEPADIGFQFDVELFSPMRHGINIVSDHFNFTENTTWLLCLDEAEFLDEDHHRILNSCLRSHSGNLYFKITTMPYQHHTQETNTSAKLDMGDDFEYIYIDQDPVLNVEEETYNLGHENDKGFSFANQVFKKRAVISGKRYKQVALKLMLGESILLDPSKENWDENSHLYELLFKYCDEKTILRAQKMLQDIKDTNNKQEKEKLHTKFLDQIGRKIKGSLLLKDAVHNLKGSSKLHIYSGLSMVVRCADGNPRRLVRIYNSLLISSRLKSRVKTKHLIANTIQNSVLENFSKSSLERVRAEKDIGPKLHEFIEAIGEGLAKLAHHQKLSTDQYGSIKISKKNFIQYRQLIERAVGLGLLYPNMGKEAQGELPSIDGEFRIAYVLAPYFKLLPRKGRGKSLSLILNNSTHNEQEKFKFDEE